MICVEDANCFQNRLAKLIISRTLLKLSFIQDIYVLQTYHKKTLVFC